MMLFACREIEWRKRRVGENPRRDVLSSFQICVAFCVELFLLLVVVLVKSIPQEASLLGPTVISVYGPVCPYIDRYNWVRSPQIKFQYKDYLKVIPTQFQN